MATSDETQRHEGGPLEKNHLKDMVQRNALETLVYNKITKHIETEKKAFTRQNTRDETEMKHLLQRLHQEQHTSYLDDGNRLSSESGDDLDDDAINDTKEMDEPVNPYPVTIIPKYGASQTKTVSKQGSPKFQRDTQSYAGGNEDFQQTANSNPSSSSSSIRTRDQKGEWLGNPEAIQSVRRPRKSVSDQFQRKAFRRSQSEQNVLGEITTGLSIHTTSASSQTSLFLSPRDRSNSFSSCKDTTSEASEYYDGALNKRGGSLKERPKKCIEHSSKPLVRSYSMLTKASLHELQNKCGTFNRPKGHDGNSKVSQQEETHWRKTRNGSLKERRDTSKSVAVIPEAGNRQKQPLSRKSSHEGAQEIDIANQQNLNRRNSHERKKKKQPEDKAYKEKSLKINPSSYISTTSVGFSNSVDENTLRAALGSKKKQAYYPNRLSPQTSPNDSPSISPLAREHAVFKY